MSKKSKAEVADEPAVIITDAVLAKNNKKLTELEQSIKAALERKQKIIVESKLYTYGQLSELYGGAEGQTLLDAVTAEHTLIGKLTASGMSYADIEGLVDSPAESVSGDDSSADDSDNGSESADDSSDNDDADNNSDDVAEGQTSLFGYNPYSD